MNDKLLQAKQRIAQIKQQRLEMLDLLYSARLEDNRHQPMSVHLKDYADSLGDYSFNQKLLLEEKLIEPVAGLKHRITGKGVFAYEQMLEALTD